MTSCWCVALTATNPGVATTGAQGGETTKWRSQGGGRQLIRGGGRVGRLKRSLAELDTVRMILNTTPHLYIQVRINQLIHNGTLYTPAIIRKISSFFYIKRVELSQFPALTLQHKIRKSLSNFHLEKLRYLILFYPIFFKDTFESQTFHSIKLHLQSPERVCESEGLLTI